MIYFILIATLSGITGGGGAEGKVIEIHPKAGIMDDLNLDGEINCEDAKKFYNLIDDLNGKPWNAKFVAGLG